MKINTIVLLGLMLLVFDLLSTLVHNSISVSTIGLFCMGISFIVSGLFEIKNHRDKNLYFAIIAAIIGSLLILAYIQLSSQTYPKNTLITLSDFVYTVVMSLLIMWVAYNFTKNSETTKISYNQLNYLLIAFIVFFIGITAVVMLMIH